MTTEDTPPLHPSIVALAALAANIASNHPNQGLCQLEKLRGMGVAEAHIATVIEVARHIRDEAGQKLDGLFDDQAAAVTPAVPREPAKPKVPRGRPIAIAVAEAGPCCTPTPSGQPCC